MTREPDTCELLCLDLPKAEAARAGLPPSMRQGRMVMYELTPLGSRLVDTITAPAAAEATG